MSSTTIHLTALDELPCRLIQISSDPKDGLRVMSSVGGSSPAILCQEIEPEQLREVGLAALGAADDEWGADDFRAVLDMVGCIYRHGGDMIAAAATAAVDHANAEAIGLNRASVEIVHRWDAFLGEGSILHPQRVYAAATEKVLARTPSGEMPDREPAEASA